LVVASILIVARVVARDTNHGDPAGLVAFTAYIFTWGTWLGMGNLFRRDKHISGISLLERLGAFGRAASMVLNLGATAVFAILCLWQSMALVIYQIRSGVPSEGALPWPRFTLTSVGPIGGALLLISVGFKTADLARRWRLPTSDRRGEPGSS
jgi:TRAP-type C4-dicarboxylate transport system permease small subunit